MFKKVINLSLSITALLIHHRNGITFSIMAAKCLKKIRALLALHIIRELEYSNKLNV
jgi:hypothetical protein